MCFDAVLADVSPKLRLREARGADMSMRQYALGRILYSGLAQYEG